MIRDLSPPTPLLVLLAASAATACSGEKQVHLPAEQPEGFAFAILHDGEQAVAAGPVAWARDTYDGDYQIRADSASLEPWLFVAEPDDVRAASAAACAALEDPVRKAACIRAVSACDDPASCLAVLVPAGDCGDRLPIAPEALSFSVFGLDADRLVRQDGADRARLLAGAAICGPRGRPACPDLMPAFVITEGGRFTCLAATRQLTCSLSVDVASCGLGRVSAEVAADGSIATTGADGDCRMEPISGDEVGFSLVCGGRRLSARYVGGFAGYAECPHRGPARFDASSGRGGVVSGLAAVDFGAAAGGERWAFAGKGDDGCAQRGCYLGLTSCAPSCATCCERACGDSELPRCIDGKLSCGPDPVADCVAVCTEFCAQTSLCSRSAGGRALLLASPEEAHRVEERFDLWRSGAPDDAGTDFKAVADVGRDGEPLLVAVDRTQVFVVRRDAASGELEEVRLEGFPDVGFEIAGVLKHPDRDLVFFVYGTDTSSTVPRAAVIRADLDVSSSPAQVRVASATLPGPSRADRAVVLPGRDEMLITSAEIPAGGAPGGTRIARLDATELKENGFHLVDGRPAALAATADGTALIALDRGGGDRPDAILVIRPQTLNLPEAIDAIVGLRITSLLADARRAFVGYTRRADLSGSAASFAGILELPSSGAPVLLPPFAAAAGASADILALDAAKARLLVVSAYDNVITPIRLIR